MIQTTCFRPALGVLLLAAATAGAQPAMPAKPAVRQADYIVAIVNNELVTQVELDQRLSRIRLDALRTGARLPDSTHNPSAISSRSKIGRAHV